MPAKLLYRDAQGRDLAVDVIEGRPAYIGRAVECAVHTEDARVSRRHCSVTVSAGQWVVEDLGSGNGTFVNEQRVQRQVLRHDDIIRCGTLQARFVWVPEAAPMPGPQPHATPQATPAHDAMAEKDAQLKSLEAKAAEVEKACADALQELEGLRQKHEQQESELKRLREEKVAAREESSKLRREASKDKEELVAVQRVVDDLRRDLRQAQEELKSTRAALDASKEDRLNKESQLEHAQNELQRAKKTSDELRAKLSDQQEKKEAGLMEFNSQLAELDQLRAVSGKHQQMIEEQRVGLVALDTKVKDLDGEKKKLQLELKEAKNERDELRELSSRQAQTIEAWEEERRRAPGKEGKSGAATGDAEVERLGEELRVVKGERARLEEEHRRALAAVQELAAERDAGRAERKRLEAELGEAERTRARLEGELAERTAAVEANRAAEGQLATLHRAVGLPGTDPALEQAERRIVELERVVDELRAAGHGAAASDDDHAAEALRERALEVYEGINEALSELRTTILTAKGVFGEIRASISDEDARDAIADSIAAAMGRAEDAKGLLRSLRELAQQ